MHIAIQAFENKIETNMELTANLHDLSLLVPSIAQVESMLDLVGQLTESLTAQRMVMADSSNVVAIW